MSINLPPTSNFSSLDYNPSFYNQPKSIKLIKTISYIVPSSQIYTGTNTYNLGSLTLDPGTYLVNVQYALQGIWSAIGSVTNCAFSINSLQTISAGTATSTSFYCQGNALQTSVTNQLYYFGINGTGIITITKSTPFYFMVYCYYTGTAVIQNQLGNVGSVSFIPI